MGGVVIPLETPEAMAERLMWAEDVLDPSTVRMRAIREDRRVIAEAAEQRAEIAHSEEAAQALRAFARALRGEP